MPVFSIPAAYEKDRVPDEFLDASYEAASAQQRAWIKTTLALVQCVHHERPSLEERTAWHMERGFGAMMRRRPAPWTLIVMGDSFGSAPRLAAALMAARLAGAADIAAVQTRPPSPSIAAALVLAGVEHVLALSPERLPDMLERLAGAEGRGRLLLFSADHGDLRNSALEADIPCWGEIRPPVIGILPPAAPNRALLEWAHPGSAVLACDPRGRDGRRWDALCAASPDTDGVRADLVLTPGLEGCWLHPGLSPDFFLNPEAAVMATVPEDENDAARAKNTSEN